MKKEIRRTLIAFGVIGIIMSMVLVLVTLPDRPIDRSEAVSYTGIYSQYTNKNGTSRFEFADGVALRIPSNAETEEFLLRMNAISAGTELSILYNPRNKEIQEIKTGTEVLLSFDTVQKSARSKMVASFCMSGIMLLMLPCNFLLIGAADRYVKKERESDEAKRRVLYTRAMRRADMEVKYRVLSEAKTEGFDICYRRVKSVNELVINGYVYDEKKGIVEFAHNLYASVNGHTIEAGFDGVGYSYILFDGDRIKQDRRIC